MAGSYQYQAELVGNEAYRLRVKSCLLEEATNKPPGWDAVYADIFKYTEKAVARLAPEHATDYASGKATGLAEPSNNVTDYQILSSVQAHWTDIMGPATPPA